LVGCVQVNPFGKVPALSDGELNLFESGALLTYLADKYGDTDTPEKR
jgi:glutathione S-transferase